MCPQSSGAPKGGKVSKHLSCGQLDPNCGQWDPNRRQLNLNAGPQLASWSWEGYVP